RRHTRSKRDWSSDVCSSDLDHAGRGRFHEVPGSADEVLRRLSLERRVLRTDLDIDIVKGFLKFLDLSCLLSDAQLQLASAESEPAALLGDLSVVFRQILSDCVLQVAFALNLQRFRLIRHCGSGDESAAEPECRSRCHSQRALHEFLLHKELSLFSEGTMSQIDDLSHGKVTGSTQ